MALTSQSSSSANFQVRGFSTEPKQFRRVSIGEQRARKKSATERLTESQGQFTRRESQEELKASLDEVDRPPELSGIYTARQVDVFPSSDNTEDLLHSSVSYVRSSDTNAVSQTAQKSQSLRPISDESQQDDPSREHSEARRECVEIVQTSFAQSQSPNEDAPISSHGEIDSKPGKKIFQRASPVLEKSPRSFPTRKQPGGGRDRTLQIVKASLKRSTSPVGDFLVSSDSNIHPKPVEKFSPKKVSPVSDKSLHFFPTHKTSGGRDRTLQIVEASLNRSTSPVDDVLVSSDSHIDPKPVERFSAKKAPPVPDKSPHSFPTRQTSGGNRNKTLEFVESSLARSLSPVGDVLVSSDSHIDPKPVERFSAKKAPPVFDKSLHSFPSLKTSGGSRNKTLEFVEASLARSTSPVGNVPVSSDSHIDPKPIERFSAKKATPVSNKSPHSFRTHKTSGGSRNKTLEFVEASLARSTSPVGDVFISPDSHIDPKPVGRFSTKTVPPVHDKSPQSFPTSKHSGGGQDRTLQIVEASLARSTSPVDLPISPREKSFPRRISPVPDKSFHSISTRKLSKGNKSFDAGANISSGDGNRSPQREDKSQPRRQSPSDHQPVEKSYPRGPSPVFNKSPHTTPIRARGGSRDRTLEIVAASLTLSASSNDGEISLTLAKNAKSSASVSPVSSREEAGGHVRKLKEHFLSVASTESESDGSHGRQTPISKLQKSDSSPSSNSLWLEKSTGDHKPAEHHSMSQKRRDVIAHRRTDDRQLGTNQQGRQRSQEEGQLKAVDHSRSQSTSSEEDPGLRNEKRGKSLPKPTSSSSDSLDEQTRRQMERFRARYAAADAAKQNGQKGKINRIVLKPPAHAGDVKDRSKSVHDPASPKTSIAQPRPQTTSEVANQPIEASVVKSTLSKPKALYSTTQHSNGERKSAEKRTNYGTPPRTPPASYERSHKTEEVDLKIPETLTSDDVRRMRRAKQLNVSGKTPERWGDAEETNKPFRFEDFHKPQKSQRAILEHAVYHGSDRTVVQVGGTTFPVKQEVSDAVYKENLPVQDPIKDDIPSGNHRRDKSTSDESSVERSSGAEEVTALLSQNQNQNDILAEEPLKPKSKHEASPTGVFYKHVMKSPQAAKGFKKTSWAPVSFGQTQDKGNTSNLGTTHHSLSPRNTISPNMNRFEQSQPEKHTAHFSSSEQPLASQDNREHAKSALQNFLSGIMSSPESPCNQTQQKGVNAENNDANPSQNDGNGNIIVTDAWTISKEANINREVGDYVNLNFSSSIGNQNKPISDGIVPPTSLELTRVHQDAFEIKQSETLGDASRGLESKSKMQHSREGLKNAEPEKRRKVSENSEASLSRRDGVHSSLKEQTGSLTEKPYTKKVSLSGLLSQDVQREQMAESQGPNEHSKKSEVDRHVKPDSKWLPPPKPDCYHGDDSGSDTDEELRRSKVLRVKKSSRAEKRTEDNSLQNLLSRIINPEDQLNTLKRGNKLSVAETSHKSAKDANSNSMYASENATMQPDVVDDKPTFRKPLLNINLLQRKNRRPVRQENLASPPESMTSPIRQGLPRRRSKSDLGMSPRCSVSSAPSEVEHFFNQMGLNDSFFGQSSTLHFSDSEDVFNNMHEYKHGRDDGSFSTEQSDNISQGSKVSEEGLHLAKKLPDTTQSIITKNARVIKWLCQMRKARAASFS